MNSLIRLSLQSTKSWDKGFAKRRDKVKSAADDDISEDIDEFDDNIEADEMESPGEEKVAAKMVVKDPKAGWRTSGKESKVRSKRVKLLGARNESTKYSAKRVRIDDPKSSWEKEREDDDSDPEAVDLGYFGGLIARARTLYFHSKAHVLNTANRAAVSLRRAKHQIQKRVDDFIGPPRVTVRGGDLWASKAAWYALMVMSRCSRLQLVMRSTVLNCVKGERARVVIKEFPPEMQFTYNKIRKQLFAECKRLVVMPQTLRELMHRPFADLRAIFESQTTTYKLCADMEDVMDDKNMGQSDCFIPLIHLAPCIARDLEAFDRSMYDVESFNECMMYEAEVTERKQVERYNQLHAIEDKERKWGETHYSHPSTASVSRKFNNQPINLRGDGSINSESPSKYGLTATVIPDSKRSVDSSGQPVAGSDPGHSDGTDRPLRSFPLHKPEEGTQETPEALRRPTRDEEAKEDAKLGKMTYSFSHILDGKCSIVILTSAEVSIP
jgi:hypothetical protein